MARVYVSLGSNIDPDMHLAMAIELFKNHFSDVIVSSLYQSEAMGFNGARFLNCVVGFTTLLSVHDLQHQCQQLEKNFVDTAVTPGSFHSRKCDIDLLLYDNCIIFDKHFQLPRSDIVHYPFVLAPLAEIAPTQLHPTLQQTFAQLWKNFNKTFLPVVRL